MVRFRHLLMALMLHGAVFALLSTGASCSRPVQKPVVIEAVLLDPSREKTAQDKRQLERERRRQQEQEEERKRVEQERRQAEVAVQRKAEEERKQKEKEEAQLKKKQQEDDAKRKQEDERKKKEREEAERKRKEEEFERELDDQRRREMQEEELRQQFAQEEQRLAGEREQRLAAERDARRAEWVGAITDKIRRNWLRPLGSSEDFQCQVLVEQLPGGQVVNRKIVKSCGGPLLDDSVLKAVDKSDPLPVVPDPTIFERRLIIIFTPKAQ